MKTSRRKILIALSLIYGALLAWWGVIQFLPGISEAVIDAFSNSIFIVALLGGAYGLFVAKKWGGVKSSFGRTILLFSLGLLSQFIGQIIYIAYDYVLDNPNPYPSFADIFFFGTIPLYIAGLLNLKRSLNIKFRKVNLFGRILTLLVPAVILIMTYVMFLNGYQICHADIYATESCSDWLTVLLDFGYPLGGAVYVSLAVLILVFAQSALGGQLKNKVLLLLAGLLAQYTAEFHYLYLTSNDEFQIGGVNDALYLTAYFLIALSIVNIGGVIDGILGGTKSNDLPATGGTPDVTPRLQPEVQSMQQQVKPAIQPAQFVPEQSSQAPQPLQQPQLPQQPLQQQQLRPEPQSLPQQSPPLQQRPFDEQKPETSEDQPTPPSYGGQQ